ncbi:MAG: hypothetical protein B7Y02_01485 [Rhodobacterales bacterium 17-64-5]|nr:MAG: hypothetical protein B7Y02_01485 [Rhodobacterales bacterium 17-64-5]
MNRNIAITALAAATAVSLGSPAAAYPVDCAILLCLAGGWPASIECAQARAVFIARITPWPVEPPLQIWNCPMHAAARRATPVEQLFDITLRYSVPSLIYEPPALPFIPLPVAEQADIDISDPVYDFVRSIHVYQISYSQNRGHDDNCNRTDYLQLGTYGPQGEYSWSRAPVSSMPTASDFAPPGGCSNYFFRSVFVDWQDYQGTYGFEEVRY